MYVRVYVTPGAKKESVGKKGERLFIAVREEAEGNRANARVRELVARECKVPVASVRMLSGHRSPSKKFLIINLTQGER